MNAAQFSSEFDFLQFSPAVAQTLEKASRFEGAVYRYDAVFQAVVVPRVYHALIVALHIIVQSAIATILFGIQCRRWWNAYNAASVPPMIEVPMLAIAPAAPLMLLPAETVFHLGRAAAEDKAMRQLCKTVMIHAIDALPGVEVLITPAPKSRKAAGIASQKAPTTARSSKGLAIAID